MTASTGIAAANVGGVTIHSWAGLGLGDKPVDELLAKLSKDARARWTNCSVREEEQGNMPLVSRFALPFAQLALLSLVSVLGSPLQC